MKPEYDTGPLVTLVSHIGGDDSVVRAMLISTQADKSLEAEATFGRINYLMKHHHGTPFEHNMFTFYVRAPIVVFREFHRHRIGFSYNEVSGRYKELKPMFYVPDGKRPLIQTGKPGEYRFEPGSNQQFYDTVVAFTKVAEFCTAKYEQLLNSGVAKEVARMVLPLSLYSEMYVTCNARSLMAFLALRTHGSGSNPMYEIEQVAIKMESVLAEQMPLTYRAFNENGRIAP